MMNRFVIKAFVYLICIFVVSSCNRDENVDRPFPRVGTTLVEVIPNVGAHFYGNITLTGHSQIIDYGFVWGTSKNLRIENKEFFSFGNKPNSQTFDKLITSTLTKGVTYYVCGYAKTADLTVYGDLSTFISLGSEGAKITSYYPTSGEWRDTVYIKGTNFSKIASSNIIYFGTIPANIADVSDSSITAIVPVSLASQKCAIQLVIMGNSTFAADSFTLTSPRITSFSPEYAHRGDTVTLNGSFNLYDTKLYIGNYIITPYLVLFSTIKFVVPNEVADSINTIHIRTGDLYYSHPEPLHLLPNTVTLFSTYSILWSTQISASGLFNNHSTLLNSEGRVPLALLKNNAEHYIPATSKSHANEVQFNNASGNIILSYSFKIPAPQAISINQSSQLTGAATADAGKNIKNAGLVLLPEGTMINLQSMLFTRIKCKIPALFADGMSDLTITRSSRRMAETKNINEFSATGDECSFPTESFEYRVIWTDHPYYRKFGSSTLWSNLASASGTLRTG